MLCGLASPTNCKTCMKGISLQRLNSRMHDPKSPSLPLPFSPSLKVWKGFLPSPAKAWKGSLPPSLLVCSIAELPPRRGFSAKTHQKMKRWQHPGDLNAKLSGARLGLACGYA